MKKQAIDEPLKAYYQGQQLSPGKLDELLALAEDAAPLSQGVTEPSGFFSNALGRRWSWQRHLAIAVSVMVLVFSAAYILQPRSFSPAELAVLVSKEIALNHNKRLALEFYAQDYLELSRQMEKLDFAPLSPKGLQTAGLKLVGARYCSIHGQLAAQLALLDDKGEYYTLYQTVLGEDLSRLPDGEQMVNGVLVQQWQEAGLFFGLAKNLR